MNLTESLLDFFSKKEHKSSDVPDGLCPNCWGQQEYGDTIRELYADKQIDVNNQQVDHAFIQEFVVNRLKGVHLKKGDDGLTCPTCLMTHNLTP